MNRKRIKKIVIRGFVVFSIMGLLFIHFILPRSLTVKRSAFKSFFRGDPVYNYDYVFEERNNYKRDKLNITSYDGLNLSGFITYSKLENPKATIILLPNSGNTKYYFLEFSEFLADNGFNSVAMDFRAFGKSEGKCSTYGIKERKDVQSVVDYLIANKNLKNFGIWGQSLGAAIAMQAMAIDNRLEFGIIESAYTDYKTNMDTYFTRLTGLKMKWFTNYVVNRSGKIGDFDADDASPIKYATDINQPVLVVHGENDLVFNIKYGKANFNAIKSLDKQFVKIDSAGHTNIWKIGGDKYFDKVLKFLNRVTE